MNKADVITKLAGGSLGVVALSAWLLSEGFITGVNFTVVATAYIVCAMLTDAVTRRRTDPQNGE